MTDYLQGPGEPLLGQNIHLEDVSYCLYLPWNLGKNEKSQKQQQQKESVKS